MLLDRRIHLITGKGGVGRTTVSVALAHAIARTGRRVLLMEIGDPEGGYSALAQYFGVEALTPTPQPLAQGIKGCHLWAPTGHELFVRSVIPAGPLVRAALRSRSLKRFLIAAPSLHEMGLFYHLLTLLRAGSSESGEPEHEVLILDMPATGHTLALTGLPRILLNLIPSGPVAKAMREGQSYINNPESCVAWVVTLPEQLPVSESLELLQGLRETSVPIGGVILNRIPVDPFTAAEWDALTNLLELRPMHGVVAVRRIGVARQAAQRLTDKAGELVFSLPEVSDAGYQVITQSLSDELGTLVTAQV